MAQAAWVALYSAASPEPFELTKTDLQNEAPEASAPERGRALALDLGAKRVGVAVSDELGLTARPLPSIGRTSWKRLVLAVRELCEQFDVRRVVVGMPLRLDGGEGEAAQEARRAARNLGLTLGLPVVLQDERLTSLDAEAGLRGAGAGREEVKARVDSEAAAIILRDYLGR